MKKKTSKALSWFTAGGLFLSPLALVAAPLNLTVFKGNFTGPMTLTSPEDAPEPGRASVVIAVPPHGKSGVLRYRATVEGSNFPTVVTLSANKRASITDLLVGIAGTNNAKAGRGNWSQRQRVLRFTGNNGDGISLRGTASVRDLANRRELRITLISTDPGSSYFFKSTALRSRLP